MKVLVLSASGDPLFVRDDDGRDFEVEVGWATATRVLPTRGPVDLAVEPLIAKAAFRVLTTHQLPALEERDAHERRARALRRLGGSAAPDEVVARRAEAAERESGTQSAPWSVVLDPWTEKLFPGIRQYVSDQGVFSSENQWKPPPGFLLAGSMPKFTNIQVQRMDVPLKTIPFPGTLAWAMTPGYGLPFETAPEAPVDPVQARREEAMRRLQDPPPEDFDASVQQDVRNLLDGLRKRPVL